MQKSYWPLSAMFDLPPGAECGMAQARHRMTRYLLTICLRLLTALAIGWDMLTLAVAAKIQLGRRWVVRRLAG